MRQGKLISFLLASLALATGLSVSEQSNRPTIVQAASRASKKYVAVRGRHRVRLYTARGKKTKAFAQAGKKYRYWTIKKLRVGRKKVTAYQLSKNRFLLAKQAARVISAPKRTYRQARLTLPAGYTRPALLKAYEGHPSTAFIKACRQGMRANQFKYAEKASDNIKLDPANLTAGQRQEITSFSLRLINQVRGQLNLPAWQYASGVQKLATDIAQEYTTHQRGIQNGAHYVAGIVRACQQNGLNFNDNYVEDMAGFAYPRTRMTMTELKNSVYFGLKQFIFGYAGSSEKGSGQLSNYKEWEHAGDIFNTQGSKHDGTFDYYGFSISRVNGVVSLHYIGLPSFAVNDSKYNKNFHL